MEWGHSASFMDELLYQGDNQTGFLTGVDGASQPGSAGGRGERGPVEIQDIKGALRELGFGCRGLEWVTVKPSLSISAWEWRSGTSSWWLVVSG